MTIYGNSSRVSVDHSGGGITAVTGGGEKKLVIFARGDPTNGTVQPNEPTQVSGPGELDAVFGAGTPLTQYFMQAAAAGQPYDQMWGVHPEQPSVVDEDITAGADAISHSVGSKIANAPIVPDTSLITVEDDLGGSIAVEFRYETNMDDTSSDFTNLSPGTDEMFINPITGEWVADASDNYNIDYDHLKWGAAFDSAVSVIEEQEQGVWAIGTASEDIVDAADQTATPLRENEWKMILVGGLARPNKTTNTNLPGFTPSNYSQTVDSDISFLFAPTRITDGTRITGSTAGLMAANRVDNPILGEALVKSDLLDQTLTVPEQESLEDEGVIPLSNMTEPVLEGGHSTSTTATGWKRTFFARQLSDRLILAARAIAKATRGDLNNDNTESIVEQQLADEIEDLIDMGVLRPNEQNEQRWFVDAAQDTTNPDELDLSFGFTPTGVVDVVEVNSTINY